MVFSGSLSRQFCTLFETISFPLNNIASRMELLEPVLVLCQCLILNPFCDIFAIRPSTQYWNCT